MNYVLRVNVSDKHYQMYFNTIKAAQYEAQIAQKYYENKGFSFDSDAVGNQTVGILNIDAEISISVYISINPVTKYTNTKVPWNKGA